MKSSFKNFNFPYMKIWILKAIYPLQLILSISLIYTFSSFQHEKLINVKKFDKLSIPLFFVVLQKITFQIFVVKWYQLRHYSTNYTKEKVFKNILLFCLKIVVCRSFQHYNKQNLIKMFYILFHIKNKISRKNFDNIN